MLMSSKDSAPSSQAISRVLKGLHCPFSSQVLACKKHHDLWASSPKHHDLLESSIVSPAYKVLVTFIGIR